MKSLPKVNELIKKEVSGIVFKILDVGRDIFTTITRVETSPNIIQSKVYVSVLPEKEADRILRILNRNVYKIQQELNKKLKMRPVPKIIFIKEESTKRADDIERLLESLKKEE